MDLTKYAKALVPVVVGGALVVMGYFGVTSEMNVKEALTLVVTAVLVYLVKNRV
jgi:hypothetical protein